MNEHEGFNSRIFEALAISLKPLPLISSRRNPLVRRLKALASRAGREKLSSFLLEGTHLLLEALNTSYFPSEIIATTSWIDSHKDVLGTFPANAQLFEVTDLVLKAALTTQNPDGVASILPLNALPKIDKPANFVLALDRVQDPGNLGNLFRTALAAEVEVIWLASGVDPLSPKVLRASSGAVLHLPYERHGYSEESAIEELVANLNRALLDGFQVLGTVLPRSSMEELSVPYWEIDWTKPTVLVLGNEGAGIHPRIKDCCTHGITLPHSLKVDSLNVASAAVPLLLERRRAKMS